MFIHTVGVAIPEQKIILGPDFLRGKEYFETETSVAFHRAAPHETPLSLAQQACQMALQQSHIPADQIDACIFAQSLLKDFQSWSLSAALCHALDLRNAMFLDIAQGCNGLAGVQYAIDLLRSRPSFQHVLVATANILPPQLGRHETIDRGGIVSDGGAAMIVSRDHGQFAIEILHTDYAAHLCDFIKLPYGGSAALRDAKPAIAWDIAACKDAFLSGHQSIVNTIRNIRSDNVHETLRQAHQTPAAINGVIVPNYCRLYNADIVQIFPHLSADHLSIEQGLQHSHMGACDAFVNLYDFQARLKKEDVILLNQDGAGFTFSSLLLRVVGTTVL